MKKEDSKPKTALMLDTIFLCLNYIIPILYSIVWLKLGLVDITANLAKQKQPQSLFLQVWIFTGVFFLFYLIPAFAVGALKKFLYWVAGLMKFRSASFRLATTQVFGLIPILNRMVKVIPLCDYDKVLFKRLTEWGKTHGNDLGAVRVLHTKHFSKATNATYIDFGRFSKLTLLDTLFDNFTYPEIEAIIAHEFGHKHDYIKTWSSLLVQLVVSALILGWGIWQVIIFESFKVLPLVFILLILSWFFIMLFNNMISRYRELFADTYAVLHIPNCDDFKNGLLKLASQNYDMISPPRIIESIFSSHPSVAKRLENIKSLQSAIPK